MQIVFEDNEFTIQDLLEYVTRAYGAQMNGSPFTAMTISTWIRNTKLPDAYGGNRILSIQHAVNFNNARVLTIDGLSRGDIEAAYGGLDEFETTIQNKRKQKKVNKSTTVRKHRTQLYYDILGKKNQTKKTLTQATVPNEPKAYGIKGNQLKKSARSKK